MALSIKLNKEAISGDRVGPIVHRIGDRTKHSEAMMREVNAGWSFRRR